MIFVAGGVNKKALCTQRSQQQPRNISFPMHAKFSIIFNIEKFKNKLIVTMVVAGRVLRPFVSLRHISANISACRPIASVFNRRVYASATADQTPRLSQLSSDQKGQIELYLDTLLDWNTRMNLTGE